MSAERHNETAPLGFDSEGWPLPEVRSLMIDNFARSWQRHWKAVGVIFGAAFFLILFATWLVTPRWEGQAKAMIYPQALPTLGLADETLGPSGGLDTEKMTANIVEVMKSREVLREVVDRTNLWKHFSDQAQKKSPRARIKKLITKVVMFPITRGRGGLAAGDEEGWKKKAFEELESTWISVAPMERSTMIPLTIYGDDPEVTARVGDALFAVVRDKMDGIFLDYIDEQVVQAKQLVGSQQSLVDALRGELQTIQTGLGYSDPDQYERETVATLVGLERDQAILQTEIDQTDAGILEAEIRLAEIERVHTLGSTDDQTVPEARQAEPIRTRLAEARAELSGLLTRYAQGHGAVKDQRAKIASLEEDYEAAKEDEVKRQKSGIRAREILDPTYIQLNLERISLSVKAAGLAARKPSLEAAITGFKEKQSAAMGAQGRLRDKTDEVRIAEADLREIKTKLSSFQTLEDEGHPFKSLMVTEKCTVLDPKDSDLPNMLLAAILAIIVGAFTALVLPVAYDYIAQTQLSSRQVVTIPGLRVVAVVPKLKPNAMFKSVSG